MNGILSGLDNLINESLGLGGAAQYWQKINALRLRSKPDSFDSVALIRQMLSRIELNWLEARRAGAIRPAASSENWRWEKKTYLSERNRSKEKILEKEIARVSDESWVNQVPTLSGVISATAERHCNIDLVHRSADSEFEFIELKVDSDTAMFAAFEILKYGVVYVFSRNHASELGYDPAKVILNARRIMLCVLAPKQYYEPFNLDWLERELSRGLRNLGQANVHMDFRFDHSGMTAREVLERRSRLYGPDLEQSMPCPKDLSRVDAKGRAYAGSQRQIQTFVNQKTGALSAAVAQSLTNYQLDDKAIRWVSPLANDTYTEYRDSEFLQVLGLDKYANLLRDFWPRGGPCWDALATTADGCILVEAKSYASEIYGPSCSASQDSRQKIVNALDATKAWLGVPPEVDWTGRLYQSANRYASLYFLREVARVRAFLVNLYFVGDRRTPTTKKEWEAAIVQVNSELRLVLEVPYCASLFLAT